MHWAVLSDEVVTPLSHATPTLRSPCLDEWHVIRTLAVFRPLWFPEPLRQRACSCLVSTSQLVSVQCPPRPGLFADAESNVGRSGRGLTPPRLSPLKATTHTRGERCSLVSNVGDYQTPPLTMLTHKASRHPYRKLTEAFGTPGNSRSNISFNPR